MNFFFDKNCLKKIMKFFFFFNKNYLKKLTAPAGVLIMASTKAGRPC